MPTQLAVNTDFGRVRAAAEIVVRPRLLTHGLRECQADR
jgi:hypothetical protein